MTCSPGIGSSASSKNMFGWASVDTTETATLQRRENIELSRRLQKKKGEEVELENKKNESERSIQIVYHEESFKNHKLELDLHHLSNSTNITQQENIGAMVQKVQEIQVSIQKTGK